MWFYAVLGSILAVAALVVGMLCALWSRDVVVGLGLRVYGRSTVGIVLAQHTDEAGRHTTIAFDADGGRVSFVDDTMPPAEPGDPTPVRYDPARPTRAARAGGSGTLATKLAGALFLPAIMPGLVILDMRDAPVVVWCTVAGFLAGVAIGLRLTVVSAGRARGAAAQAARVRAAEDARPPGWWSRHLGDVLVALVAVAAIVGGATAGHPPWEMPVPLVLATLLVPYAVTRWLVNRRAA